MRKKILIIIFVLAFMLLFGGIVLSFLSKDDNTDSPSSQMTLETQTKQSSEKAVRSLMDTSMTPQKLKKLYGVNMGSDAILVGKNSILREKSDLEKTLTNYSKAQDYYAKKVEKKIQDTFSYRFGDYLVADEGANVIQKLYFKSYYLELYIMDLNLLQDMLLNQIGFSVYNIEHDLTDDDLKLMYKAKVKAMELLDSHLDNYVNTTEEIEYDLIYSVEDKNKLGPLDYYSLVSNVSGIMYSVLTDITVEGSANYVLQQTRVSGYMNAVFGTTEEEVLKLEYK